MEQSNIPYEQGKNAYKNGVALNDSPYSEITQDYVDWQDGWIEADWEEKKISIVNYFVDEISFVKYAFIIIFVCLVSFGLTVYFK